MFGHLSQVSETNDYEAVRHAFNNEAQMVLV